MTQWGEHQRFLMFLSGVSFPSFGYIPHTHALTNIQIKTGDTLCRFLKFSVQASLLHFFSTVASSSSPLCLLGQPANSPHVGTGMIIEFTSLVFSLSGFTVLSCLSSSVWKPLFHIFFCCRCSSWESKSSSCYSILARCGSPWLEYEMIDSHFIVSLSQNLINSPMFDI